MRWILKTRPPTPNPGDTRIVSKFLFLPRKIGNEIRWLEVANIRQQWCYPHYAFLSRRHWENREWVY